MLLSIRPFKCLDFKTFCFVVIYIIVAKNLFIYIKLYYGRVPVGPQWTGMGQGSLPRTPGRGWGRATTMQGRDEDPILRPHPAPLPSLLLNLPEHTKSQKLSLFLSLTLSHIVTHTDCRRMTKAREATF